jgi:hypothetical protein
MLISLVIPTRDRAEVLRYCLDACARIQDRNVEFVVSDNASIDDTEETVARLKDSRFRYVRTPQRCSMRQNFEFGVSQARGDYVFTLGDDDAPIPSQFQYMRELLERHRPDTLTGSFIRYIWPGPLASGNMGRIKLKYSSVYGTAAWVSGEQTRKDLEANGAVMGRHAPSIYRGVASRQTLDALMAKSGQLFMATWPDIYFTFAAPAVVERHLIVQHPFTVSGASPRSNGASFNHWNKKEDGNQEHVKFLAEADLDPVADIIPIKSSLQIGMLSHLESANRYAYGNSLPINYEREIERALRSLNVFDPAKREEGVRALAQFASERNLAPALSDAEALLSRCEPVSRSPGAGPAKVRSYLSASRAVVDLSGSERTDIDAAVAAYEFLIGSPKALGGAGRLLAWLQLIRRALRLLAIGTDRASAANLAAKPGVVTLG